jgi:hypothetical protein
VTSGLPGVSGSGNLFNSGLMPDDINETRVYGPDFSSTGAYHLEAPFLKGNADYTIIAAIIAINTKPPHNQITNDFTLRTIS